MENSAVLTAKDLKGFKADSRLSGTAWYLLLFAVSFFGMMFAFVPTITLNNGIFLYYGDFNSQQEMFYFHANEMVRSGNFGWDWGTDLGSSFIGSYSFYLLGSPFFWLTTLFPIEDVKYLLPWLLSLKTAVAAVTACAYIRRFVKGWEACCIGGLLYAFSGFQVYNVFFNHFHDVTAFFPMLLLAFEQHTQDKRRGVFAISVAICASVSYFFFVCEVVFVVIYFFIRCMDKEFYMDVPTFITLGIEAVIGVALSGVILMPAVYDVLKNPRLNGRLYGNDMLFYGESVRIPRIIQAFFMMSDMPARVNILKSDSARWASIAGYMPLFGMTGVVAYIRDKHRSKKADFAVRLVIVSGIMMCIPWFNSAFVALNSSYYARWYFMPILIMALMTAKLFDEQTEKLKLGYIFSTAVGCSFLLIGLLPRIIDGKVTFGQNYQYPILYKLQVIVTVVLAAVMGIIIYLLPRQKHFKKIVAGVTSVCCILTMFAGVNFGAVQDGGHDEYIEYAINGRKNLDMDKLDNMDDVNHLHPDNTFFRIDTSESVDNWCLFWGLSSMRNFNSVVAPSIMDFYTSIGQTRDVASRMEPKLYALRSMLSVRYYFKRVGDEQDRLDPPETVNDLVGFRYIDTQNDFHIFENQFWIPMGYAYDTYTTKSVIDKTVEAKRPNVMLEAAVLTDEQIEEFGSFMTEFDENTNPDDLQFIRAASKKRQNSCYRFSYDTNGFDAAIDLDKESLVFFSVPYADGWTAEVNGVPAKIEKVNFGLMAVVCPAGDNSIHFSYKTAWLREGKIASAAGAGLFVIYLAIALMIDNKKRKSEAKALAAEKAASSAENSSEKVVDDGFVVGEILSGNDDGDDGCDDEELIEIFDDEDESDESEEV
ncbi:MAG: YfhO family protein [Ruminococcus sp.]|nr:YfhO family protein [Ruminococcus sp.]